MTLSKDAKFAYTIHLNRPNPSCKMGAHCGADCVWCYRCYNFAVTSWKIARQDINHEGRRIWVCCCILLHSKKSWFISLRRLASWNQWASWQVRKIAGCACAGNAGTFSPPQRINDPDMHHGTYVTHVLWCVPGSLTSIFLWSRCREKCSRHSRRTRNPQFYVSGKRPMVQDDLLQPVSGLWYHSLIMRHTLSRISMAPLAVST